MKSYELYNSQMSDTALWPNRHNKLQPHFALEKQRATPFREHKHTLIHTRTHSEHTHHIHTYTLTYEYAEITQVTSTPPPTPLLLVTNW